MGLGKGIHRISKTLVMSLSLNRAVVTWLFGGTMISFAIIFYKYSFVPIKN